ncbi:unnamed protein product [Eruca vesicaria subsp. sativa]|uniref:Uncharacterized protein n=1 Tax=Eruca vesicaria subsp. sativa TaxID=29727 RepID=A0ABC8JT95_ERUVS|nr:unnamed protein product [Eruca vesicaria subsp. sativa]
MTDKLIRVTGILLGCYVGYIIQDVWVSDLEEKRQEFVRESFWYHEEPQDLREKMWSDFKVVRMWSDLKKKISSLPEGVKLLSDLADQACSELREKTLSDPGERICSELKGDDEV